MENSLRLYSEEEMIDEVCRVIRSMGGVVDLVDKNNHLFRVTIGPEFEEEAAKVIKDIIAMYSTKREEALKKNPLLRALNLRKEIYGDEEV